ncbi:protein of unknown function [Saccharopolyspora kobensis]|uniref:DUF4178 domain-containing protein n=1 Tax=Saccharopolyspora kobensis TaxID=146035 RepID=A0A1H6EKZ6_9PSEU|nr:DUF4178 domain-containing protein [Saccharopolyspora kobensis]SEG97535.1 protein of unknown function [Saccharopolyspora kobensis]SFE94635.1 protein of unknown function [Saccharopolyspora kobensis]
MNGLVTALIIVVIVLIIVAVVAVVMGMRAKRAASEPQPQPPADPFHTGDQDSLRGDPRALKAGDIVEVRGRSFTVRGTLRLSEGGWTWSEHLLDDAKGTQVWLAVEEDPDLILSLWTPVDDAGEPGPKTIAFGGRTYHSEESGSADFRSEATTGLAESGTVRYHDYESSDGALLGFESYGGADWEASTGEALSRYDVLIYPTAS